jgi:hypothetical protein
VTTLTALEGRELVFSDGSRLTPPDWLAVSLEERGVLFSYVDGRGKDVGYLLKLGDTDTDATRAIGWLVRHHETYRPEASAT